MHFNLHVKSTVIKNDENKIFILYHGQNDLTILVSS